MPATKRRNAAKKKPAKTKPAVSAQTQESAAAQPITTEATLIEKPKLSAEERRAKRIENLRPYQWRKGESGNVRGRPIKRDLEKMYAEIEPKSGKTYGYLLNKGQFIAGARGNAGAAAGIYDRIEGKPDQVVQVQGEFDHHFVTDDDRDTERIARALLRRLAEQPSTRRVEGAVRESEPGLRITRGGQDGEAS